MKIITICNKSIKNKRYVINFNYIGFSMLIRIHILLIKTHYLIKS